MHDDLAQRHFLNLSKESKTGRTHFIQRAYQLYPACVGEATDGRGGGRVRYISVVVDDERSEVVNVSLSSRTAVGPATNDVETDARFSLRA